MDREEKIIKRILAVIAIIFAGGFFAYHHAPEKIIEKRLDEAEKIGIAWFRFQATFSGHTYTGGTKIFSKVMTGQIKPESVLILREKAGLSYEIIGIK